MTNCVSPKFNITVFGAGYVGLVTGICFADLGNQVVVVDVDVSKIEQLQQGHAPIYEPGLDELLQKNLAAGRIVFTHDIKSAVMHGEIQFIAVGTPSDHDGSADLKYVLSVAKSIGEYLQQPSIIINKSTAPVGSAFKVRDTIANTLQQRNANISFEVASNPEFLKEGSAIKDFMFPDRIVVGASNAAVIDKLQQLYSPLIDASHRFIAMDIASAELTKYAANAFLATKISFMNEMSLLAEKVGADIEKVREGIGSDSRIGTQFLYAGCGYGGSCFPKDVRALQKLSEQQHIPSELLAAVENINARQKQVLIKKIQNYFNNQLKDKVIAVWGLAFKPNTNDMREASSRVLIEALWEQGAIVHAYDPIARNEALHIYGQRDDFKLYEKAEAALEGADILAIVTEWQEFRDADLQLIKNKLRYPIIFDGRNLFDPATVKAQGLSYYAIGRGER